MEKQISKLCRNLMMYGALLALLSSAVVFAAPGDRRNNRDPQGISEALDMCYRLTFSSDQQTCAQVVQTARSQGIGFQPEAVRVCANSDFGSGAINCINAIKGRRYIRVELEACDRESFDSGRVRCLETSGVADNNPGGGGGGYPQPGPCISTRDILADVRDARLAVQQRRPRAAEAVLDALERDLLRCP